MSIEDPDAETFRTSLGLRQLGSKSPNLFNLILDYALSIYKQRCEEMSTDYLHIPYYMINKSENSDPVFPPEASVLMLMTLVFQKWDKEYL